MPRSWVYEPLRPYLAFGQAAFQRQLVYRSANWAGLSTNMFFMLLRAYAFSACFEHRSRIEGFTVQDITTYVTVTQALIMVAPQWGALGLADSVRTGQVAIELLRPVNTFYMYVAQRLSISLYYIFARSLPLLGVSSALGLLHLPPSWRVIFPLAISITLASLIAISLIFLVETSSFWLESDRGFRILSVAAGALASGLTVPINFLGPWLKVYAQITPFTHTLNSPTQIWLGQLYGTELLVVLGTQLFWVITLFILCQWILRRGMQHVQVVGG